MAAAQGLVGQHYHLGPRIPLRLRDVVQKATQVVGRDIPSRVVARASSKTSCDDSNDNLCEKPEGGNSMTIPIVIGVLVPLAVIACVLFYLHRRNVKRVRKEDTMDLHKSLDFGLAVDPSRQAAKPKRRSAFFGGEKEGISSKSRQLSMDMNLSSPYLLPPEIQQSRESLNSLARSLHHNEDPYRPVTLYTASDAGSLRSLQRDNRDGLSVYGGNEDSGMPRSASATSGRYPRPNRLSAGPNSIRSRSPLLPPYPEKSAATPPPPMAMPTSPPRVKDSPPRESAALITEESPVADAAAAASVGAGRDILAPGSSTLQVPEPAAGKIPRKGLPSTPKPQAAKAPEPEPASQPAYVQPSDEPLVYESANRGPSPSQFANNADLDLQLDFPGEHGPYRDQLSTSPPKLAVGPFDDEHFVPGVAASDNRQALPNIALPFEEQAMPAVQESHHYTNTELYPEDQHQQQYDEDRGRSAHRRQSSEYPPDNAIGQAALGIPQMDTRRTSVVGFRPLPPDELMDSEDPETRANRIRSFYKEYFEDSKPDMAEYNQHYPPQGIPTQWRDAAGAQQYRAADDQYYYEDYDNGYNTGGDANAYFDPQSNAFVMPYAQPVSRRAMTPPPSGSRFPGGRPRGGPRNFHGSVGGEMGMRGGPMMRPGSSMSGGFSPRPGSSMSNRMPGPRSASNMSGRIGGPRKPLPPPEDLVTLPTPSKLKDDSFALMGAIEFAPPPTFKDQASGRPQSPLGERRPYQLSVPVSSPLVSAFEEMPGLPSPYLLRKSSTFTGLDFAPPRKFKDADTMSDAGSIRSNRSGMSAMQQAAIRSGAGRVSRLPGDTVFTQASLADQLKPSWGMRP